MILQKLASTRLSAATMLLFLMTAAAPAAETGEVDPASVSAGLKAIFSYGSGKARRTPGSGSTRTP
jgi:hypothetical protein